MFNNEEMQDYASTMEYGFDYSYDDDEYVDDDDDFEDEESLDDFEDDEFLDDDFDEYEDDEESLYDYEEDDDDDYDEEGFDFGDEDTTIYEVKCICGNVIAFDEETLEAGSIICDEFNFKAKLLSFCNKLLDHFDYHRRLLITDIFHLYC